MEIKILNKDIIINTVPLEKIVIEDNNIEIHFDDNNDVRFVFETSSYQAIRVTTRDCMNASDYINELNFYDGRYHNYMLEILNSSWINELKQVNEGKQVEFLNESHHYFLLLGDNVVEIIAYNNFNLKQLGNS
ncbi:hypothetical protein [Candidatus Enterococcus clewellii]|uniref:Uncharacterized protein n=1 Tax=Candidatus Enterococcus clewellii TaxID=1834193 RepID=A0A242JYY4_9ENTE|nr:hypothetical protein [Enterococcus sp. 9E7_DIV0242]OTP10536.1 hypothetical protein A5888_003834 [Enterococcus sp. 9E7_DIV0242]